MSTRNPNGELNSRPAPAVIRQTPLSRGGEDLRGLQTLLAGLLSVIVHGVFLLLFWLVLIPSSSAEDTTKEEILDGADVESAPTSELDLTKDELGINPDVASATDVARIEDVVVPGPAVPSEVVGMANGEDGLPHNIPPPPGVGNGQGGAIQSLTPGNASPFSTAGGMQGPLNVPGSFGARFASGATRMQQVTTAGGNRASENAVAMALQWLAKHQANDGSWSMDRYHQHARDRTGPGAKQFPCNCTGRGMKNDVAGTAFGVLPFLAAGQTHKPSAAAKDKPEHDYTKNVAAALAFLVRKQDKSSGQLGGMYEHGLATIALCEAYGMTSDPGLRVAAQRAVNYIVAAQHDAGGWRYGPKQAGDTSVVGWQVMALKSGKMAGLSVPQPVFDGAGRFLDSVMDRNNYGYGYTTPGSSPTLTAVGLLCREYMGWSPKKVELIHGVDYMKRTPPSPSNMYYSYYATQVMHHMGGDNWKNWNEKMRDMLIKEQDKGTDPKHPHQKGSWNPASDQHGGAWGRVGETSLSVLTLEVYYRHLPLYRRELGTVKPDTK
jgi:hypothetical protein